MRDYIPLIVGFGAVILATLGNTALEWFRRNLNDRREAGALRTAFAEELRVQRTFYANAMSKEQRAETKGHFLVPIDRFMPVYDALIGKVGLLKPNEAAAVLKAYSNIILIPKNLFVMGRLIRDDFASYAEVPVKYAEVLANMNQSLVEVIDEALGALDP